jgi:hypothetical protein
MVSRVRHLGLAYRRSAFQGNGRKPETSSDDVFFFANIDFENANVLRLKRPSPSLRRARERLCARVGGRVGGMSSTFARNVFGLTGPAGLASWGVAGVGAYFFFYLPEQRKEQAELERRETAARLMRGKNYVEFVKEHEAKSRKTGWFGSWFGGGKKEGSK